MTRFSPTNTTNLREVADQIVRHLDRVSAKNGHDVSGELRVAAGNGRESGRWTKDGSVSGDIPEITVRGRPPLTDDQIAAIVFNETRALHGPDLHKARVEMAATIINADEETGGSRVGYKTAPAIIQAKLTPEEEKVLQKIEAAVAEARALKDSGNDLTHYATNFDTPRIETMKPLRPTFTIESDYRNFWDSNEKRPKKIRIWQNPDAKRHRPK
jgi:hypothetical protein